MENGNEKISSLTKLNEELENYFGNTIIPEPFINGQLILRKFTALAIRQFSLKIIDPRR